MLCTVLVMNILRESETEAVIGVQHVSLSSLSICERKGQNRILLTLSIDHLVMK